MTNSTLVLRGVGPGTSINAAEKVKVKKRILPGTYFSNAQMNQSKSGEPNKFIIKANQANLQKKLSTNVLGTNAYQGTDLNFTPN